MPSDHLNLADISSCLSLSLSIPPLSPIPLCLFLSVFQIWSYIVSGELEHKDSLGNLEIMKRGEVQMTSTGTGISHSEYNRNPKTPVHFLQVRLPFEFIPIHCRCIADPAIT